MVIALSHDVMWLKIKRNDRKRLSKVALSGDGTRRRKRCFSDWLSRCHKLEQINAPANDRLRGGGNQSGSNSRASLVLGTRVSDFDRRGMATWWSEARWRHSRWTLCRNPVSNQGLHLTESSELPETWCHLPSFWIFDFKMHSSSFCD